MDGDASVRLPGGRADGVGSREAVVRGLRGVDEEWLYSLPPAMPEARLVTELLARCVMQIDAAGVDPAVAGDLTVGDREVLVLHISRLSFGDRVDLVVQCPKPDCASMLDVDFRLTDVPVHERPVLPAYELHDVPAALQRHPDSSPIRFRQPTGADLERLPERSADADPAVALVRSCLLDHGELTDPGAEDSGEWWNELVSAVGVAMEVCAPGVDHDIETTCPACGEEFTVDFDPVRGFLGEVVRRRSEYDSDIHLLAFHYHWSPADILALPRTRRREFVRLLLERIDASAAPVPAGRVSA